METRLPRLAQRFTEPQILFPLSAVATLILIWGGTWLYMRQLRADVEKHARESTQQILETYEAQVIRSLGEIDQAMDLVTFWRGHGPDTRMAQLSERELLPPDLLFAVSVADATGRIVDSTRAENMGQALQTPEFAGLRAGEEVIVGRPRADSGGPRLQFGRRLETPDGKFDGAVMVDVDADYFVSGYEEAVLGKHGLLALIGADGALRVQRSGEKIVADSTVDYRALLRAGTAGAATRLAAESGPDDTARWNAFRGLSTFPLSVVVGLSVNEQYATLSERERSYYALAIAASLVSLIVLGLLGRLSWQLGRSPRARSADPPGPRRTRRVPRLPRRPDGIGEPQPVQQTAVAVARRSRPLRSAAGCPLPGPGSLQAHQRYARTRGR